MRSIDTFFGRFLPLWPGLAFFAGLFLCMLQPGWAAQRAGEEIRYPAKAFAKLDTFEALNLEDGDKLFAKKDYRGAFAAYKAYSEEFPKGKALPYALLRMARCLHLLNKRHSAIKAYQDVVDYFPNHVVFAAGALFYMGQAHQQNGDDKKCLATWARMVKDKDYVTQPNSGTALVHLSREMDKVGKYEEATEYRWRIAVNFRVSNHRAARSAKEAVRFYYVVRSPNHEKFKKFYKEVGGWHRHEEVKDLENSPRYWNIVFDTVLRDHGQPGIAKEKRIRAARYWTGKFGKRLAKHDGVQKQYFDALYMIDQDTDAWVARMNRQAASGAMTPGRYNWWIGAFDRNPKAQADFMAKHSKVLAGAKYSEVLTTIDRVRGRKDLRSRVFREFLAPKVGALKPDEQIRVLEYLTRYNVRMGDAAKVVLHSMKPKTLTDKQLVKVANIAGGVLGEEGALGYFKMMKDKQASRKAIYDFYFYRSKVTRRGFNKEMAEKALAMIPELSKNPDYAEGLLWPKALLLHHLGNYPDAIKAYKAANRQPESTWGVVDCLIRMKNYPKAISTVRTLESIGGGVAAEACLKVADIYKKMDDKGKEVDQLRLVLRRYPKSSQSSEAHRRLESYGAKVTGGQARAEE